IWGIRTGKHFSARPPRVDVVSTVFSLPEDHQACPPHAWWSFFLRPSTLVVAGMVVGYAPPFMQAPIPPWDGHGVRFQDR
ncbi:MAG: hypothetical protein PHQ40_09170, partial [Anaerolineaceae bacterium]|nr:hypothetical protein [Anaerolineaceae bacterium]